MTTKWCRVGYFAESHGVRALHNAMSACIYPAQMGIEWVNLALGIFTACTRKESCVVKVLFFAVDPPINWLMKNPSSIQHTRSFDSLSRYIRSKSVSWGEHVTCPDQRLSGHALTRNTVYCMLLHKGYTMYTWISLKVPCNFCIIFLVQCNNHLPPVRFYHHFFRSYFLILYRLHLFSLSMLLLLPADGENNQRLWDKRKWTQ